MYVRVYVGRSRSYLYIFGELDTPHVRQRCRDGKDDGNGVEVITGRILSLKCYRIGQYYREVALLR